MNPGDFSIILSLDFVKFKNNGFYKNNRYKVLKKYK